MEKKLQKIMYKKFKINVKLQQIVPIKCKGLINCKYKCII